jgi:hypothetical protein
MSSSSSFPFLALLQELQWEVSQQCDVASRQCLFLTCKGFYFTDRVTRPGVLSRPRLPWRAFAEHCVKEGHTNLIAWAKDDLHMAATLFTVWAVDAARREHKAVLAMPLFAKVHPDAFKTFLIEEPRYHDFYWLHSRFSATAQANLALLRIIRTNNMAALRAIPRDYFRATFRALPDTFWSVALAHGTYELVTYLVTSFHPPLTPPPSLARLAHNPDPAVWSFVARTFDVPQYQMGCYLAAITGNNTALLRQLPFPRMQQAIDTTSSLHVALSCLAFASFDWLRQEGGIAWTDDALLGIRPPSDEFKHDDGPWLAKIVAALRERKLPFRWARLRHVSYLAFDARLIDEFKSNGVAIDYARLLLFETKAPGGRDGKYDFIETLMTTFDATALVISQVAAAILVSYDASFAQRQRLLAKLLVSEQRDRLIDALLRLPDALTSWNRKAAAIALVEAHGVHFEERHLVSLLISPQPDWDYVKDRLQRTPLTANALMKRWPLLDAFFPCWERLTTVAPLVAPLGIVFPQTHIIEAMQGLLTTHGKGAAVVPHLWAMLKAGIRFGRNITSFLASFNEPRHDTVHLVRFVLEAHLPWCGVFFTALLVSAITDEELDAALDVCQPVHWVDDDIWAAYAAIFMAGEGDRLARRRAVLAKHGLLNRRR